MQKLDRIFNRDDVRAPVLVDVLDHSGECRGLPRSSDARNENEAARLHRNLFEDWREIELCDRARLIRDGTHGVAERSALLVDVHTESTDAGHTDREVALLLLRELLDLPGRHQLLRERLEVFWPERWSAEGLELTVDAQRRRPADLQMQVRRVALNQLLQHGLEVEARGRSRLSRRRGSGSGRSSAAHRTSH